MDMLSTAQCDRLLAFRPNSPLENPGTKPLMALGLCRPAKSGGWSLTPAGNLAKHLLKLLRAAKADCLEDIALDFEL